MMTRFHALAATLAFALSLAACTSEYASLPEPSGQWAPAIPPPSPAPLSAAAETAP